MKIIIQMADLHDKVVDVTECLNSCFSITVRENNNFQFGRSSKTHREPIFLFQMLLSIPLLFVFNLCSLFANYRFVINFDHHDLNIALALFLWSLLLQIYSAMSIFIASATTRIGKGTAVLVHKAMNYCGDEKIIQIVSHYENFGDVQSCPLAFSLISGPLIFPLWHHIWTSPWSDILIFF